MRSSKCHGCEKQMKTKGKRLDGIVFTNADPRYAGKLNDPQEGDTIILMQQVREVTTVNQRIKLDLANVGADGVSTAVGICESESR